MYISKNFLPNIKDAKEQQYLMLREAVWKHMEAQRTIATFSISAILAFYTIIFSIKITEPYVFLLPIIILLPFSYKELNHKISISYIAAYQIVCLENIENVKNAFTWETDFFLFNKKNDPVQRKGIWNYLSDSEFFLLSLMSYIFYIKYFLQYKFAPNELCSLQNILGYFFIIIFAVIILIIGKITKKYHLYVNSIEYYIKEWLKYMYSEKRIDVNTYNYMFNKLTENNQVN